MVLTRDEELWGAALTIERQFGEEAASYVAGLLGAALVAGDLEGVATLKEIAVRLEELMRPKASA